MKASFLHYLLLFFGINFKEVTPFKERVAYLRTSIAIALPFTLLFSVINYLTGFYNLAAVEAFTAILFLLPALLIGHHKNRVSFAEYLVLVYGMLITIALVIFGGIAGTGALWIFAFPFIAFLLKGQKIGWHMCILWMIVMSSSMAYSEVAINDAKLFYIYPEGFKPQLVIAMFFFSLIAAAFNLARSRFEILLIDQVKNAEAENRFKSEFLANVSHEIRTPMNAIYNLVDFAIHAKDEEQKNLHLVKLKTSTKRLLTLLNNILDFSKLEKKAVGMDFMALNLQEEFTNVDNMLSASYKAKNISLDFDINDDVPESIVADPIKIHQVLINIIGNAIKFTPENGQINVNCELIKKHNAEVTLLFCVKDNGIGMSDAQIAIIFDSFKQADSSTSRRFGGTGLGLAIVKQLVELMEGKVWVESELNQGSTFYIELTFDTSSQKLMDAAVNNPLANSASGPVPVTNLNSVSNPAMIESHDEYPRLNGLNILLVEDDEINQYVATKILNDVGINIVIADNGQMALDILKANSDFDAILMDINMPVMNGFEATREIRKLIPYRHKPILGLSANVLPEDLEKGIEAGINCTLSKPILKNELMHSLEQYMFGGKPLDKALIAEKSDTANLLFKIEGLDLLDSFLSNHPEVLGNILFMFAEKYSHFDKEAAQLLKLQDFENLRIMAHSLKSNLANFGMTKLSHLAGKLEKACSQDHDSCEILLSRLNPKIDELVKQINSAREQKNN